MKILVLISVLFSTSLLAEEKNIREVTMFPMNQNAQDLLMNAPSDISDEQLEELSLAIKKK